MAGDVEDFLAEYDELAGDVRNADWEALPRQLRRWLQSFDDAPRNVRERVSWLESLTSLEAVQKDVLQEQSGMGPGSLEWPDDREQRLAAQLVTFRALSGGELDVTDFSHSFFYVRNGNINDVVRKMLEQTFDPLISELRRYLRRTADTPIASEVDKDGVPAADRTVRLDHNSAAYAEAIEAVDNAETALLQTNVGEPEDREQRLSEISAGRRLLDSTRVRIAAITTVLLMALTYVAKIFAETAAGMAATKAIEALMKLLGA